MDSTARAETAPYGGPFARALQTMRQGLCPPAERLVYERCEDAVLLSLRKPRE